MNAAESFDESALHAYVDGRLEDAARGEAEAWLADHPADAARVHAYRAQNAGLHELFDGVLGEPVPGRLTAAVSAPVRPRARVAWRRLAAGVALFALGGIGGWVLHGSNIVGPASEPPFVRQAVDAYRVYASEVRHPVEVGADQEAHLVGWLSKRVGSPLKAPNLAGLGFHLMGGRLLPAHGQAAAQLMYENAAGKRITMYLRAAGRGTNTAFRFVSDGTVSAFYWIDAPLSCALTAEMPRQDLLSVANAVYAQYER